MVAESIFTCGCVSTTEELECKKHLGTLITRSSTHHRDLTTRKKNSIIRYCSSRQTYIKHLNLIPDNSVNLLFVDAVKHDPELWDILDTKLVKYPTIVVLCDRPFVRYMYKVQLKTRMLISQHINVVKTIHTREGNNLHLCPMFVLGTNIKLSQYIYMSDYHWAEHHLAHLLSKPGDTLLDINTGRFNLIEYCKKNDRKLIALTQHISRYVHVLNNNKLLERAK